MLNYYKWKVIIIKNLIFNVLRSYDFGSAASWIDDLKYFNLKSRWREGLCGLFIIIFQKSD